jgi:hypothetical protein
MATTVLTLQQCPDPKSNALQMVERQQCLLQLSTDWLMGPPRLQLRRDAAFHPSCEPVGLIP